MIRIAFCDDERHYLKNMSELIKQELEEMKLEYDIETYENGNSLLKDYIKGEEGLDIIFLDIEMKEIDGISLASRIRQMDEQVILVFLTIMENRVYDAFGYNVFKFIKKNQEKDKIREVFRECIRHATLVRSIYLFNTPDGIIRITEKEIVYFERILRKFYVNTIKGNYRINIDKFEEILEIIENHHFLKMVNRSVLVNLRYVDEITKNNEVIIRCGNKKEIITLSRGKKKEFYDSLIAYIK